MTEESGRSLSRRGFVRTVAGATAAAAVADPAAAQDTDADFDGWFGGDTGGETGNFDGSVADMTGRSEVTVEVGADGNGGTFAFAPPAVRVDPGTTVLFQWTSDTHNVLIEDQPDGAGWEGVEAIENEGFEHEHTFETEGTYKYYCQPHLQMGMKGAVVVGGSGGADGTPTGTPGEGEGGGDGGDGGGETVDVAVGPGGEFVFEPGTDSPLRIAPGTTVRWVWESDNHNIVVEEKPSDSDWEGYEDLENTGFEYEHTFEVLGEYHYYCQPHRASGMVADIVVTEDPSTPEPEPAAVEPALPETAKALGVAAAAAMGSTLALAYAFIKYGGGGPREE